MLQMLLKGMRPEKYRDRMDVKVKKTMRFSGSMTELLAMYRDMVNKGEA